MREREREREQSYMHALLIHLAVPTIVDVMMVSHQIQTKCALSIHLYGGYRKFCFFAKHRHHINVLV